MTIIDSEERDNFFTLLELSPLMIAIHTDGVFTYVNPYTASLLAGGDKTKIIGKTISDFVQPEYQDLVARSLAVRGQSQGIIEYQKQRIITNGGKVLFIRGLSTPIMFDGAPSVLALGENITETSTLMTALAESEDKFRLLVENAHDYIYKCTHRGNFVYMNPSGLNMLGYDKETLYRLNYTDFIPHDFKSEEYRFYRTQLQKNLPETYHEMPIQKRDGSMIWIGQYVTLVHETGVPFFYGVARDITELRKIRMALEESGKKYRDILENMREGYFETDLKGMITYFNNAAYSLSGTKHEDIERGFNYSQMMTPRTAQLVYEGFHRVYLTGKEEKINYDIIASDGNVVNLEASTYPRYNDKKEIIGFSGIIQNVTERVKAEKALKENEKTYRLLAENSNDIIWVLDAETLTFTYTSPSIQQVRGLTVEEALKERLEDVFPPEHYTRVLGFVASELEKEKTGLYDPNRSITFEAEQYTKDGSTIWVEINTRFLRDEQGALVGVQGSTRDITDRKRVEKERDNYAERLEELVKEKTKELSIRIDQNQQEMEAAQQVQRAILPQQPPRSNLIEVGYRYLPMDTLGGDYISFTTFHETNSLGIFIGDVSGHGVEAALYTMMIKAISDRLLREHGLDPAGYVTILNQELCKSMQFHYFTAIYGIVTLSNNTLSFTFTKAGHPPPILYSKERDSVSYISAQGTALGLFEGSRYQTEQLSLQKGDRIYLYTDGFIEALNQDHEIFGFDAFLSLVHQAHRSLRSVEDTLDYINGEIEAYRNGTPQDDDMVIIGIEAR